MSMHKNKVLEEGCTLESFLDYDKLLALKTFEGCGKPSVT